VKKIAVIFAALLLLSAGCKVSVSLDGASIPDNVNTVSVEYFETQAPLTNPNFPQIITEALRDKFIRQTRLKLVSQDGDVQFKGAIVSYSTAPVAISGSETASLTRLTISVSVEYENTLDDTQNFSQTFSRFADFNATQSLSTVESTLMTEISDQLVQDIFNRAFLNW
jgi:hypothetical protein